MRRLLFAYLILINAAAFLLMRSDKYRAKNKLWRFPESILLTAAALGGSAGAFCGMYLFRHKTRKPKFRFGVPVCLALNIAVLVLIAVI